MLKGKTKSTLVMVCLWIVILGDREMSFCLGDDDADSDVDGEAGEAACTGAVGRANGTGPGVGGGGDDLTLTFGHR